MQQRRALLKTGAKVAGGVALASMGISTLFADSNNSHRVNAGQDTQGVTLLGDSKIPFKNGERIPARGYAAFGKNGNLSPILSRVIHWEKMMCLLRFSMLESAIATCTL